MRFVKFLYAGYVIAPDGRLLRGGKVCNTTDKRRRVYYVINRKLPKTDRLGRDLYERDIVFDGRYGLLATLVWSDTGCAFVMANRTRGLTVKYRYCDWRDTVELIGNEYATAVQQITARHTK